MVTKRLTGTDEDRYAAAAADGARLPPGVETEPDDRRPGGVGGDHPRTPGGGAAVPTQAGFEIDLLRVDIHLFQIDKTENLFLESSSHSINVKTQ
jgi:hypothetical protein